jgi:hypothetical protein
MPHSIPITFKLLSSCFMPPLYLPHLLDLPVRLVASSLMASPRYARQFGDWKETNAPTAHRSVYPGAQV